MRREVEIINEEKDSIEISRGMKGNFSYSIKCYGTEETLKDKIVKLKKIAEEVIK